MSDKLVKKLKVISANKVSSDSATAKIIDEAAKVIESHNINLLDKKNYINKGNRSKNSSDYENEILKKFLYNSRTNNKIYEFEFPKNTLIFDIDTILGGIFKKRFKKYIENLCKLYNINLVECKKTERFGYTISISGGFSIDELVNIKTEIEENVALGWWLVGV